MLSNLVGDRRALLPADLATLLGEFARASLTLDWSHSGEAHAAALLSAADPLDGLRFTPLRQSEPPGGQGAGGGDGTWWCPDGSRPLKRCGFACHRLEALGAPPADGDCEIAISALPPSGGAPPHSLAPPCDLLLGVAEFDPATRTRHTPVAELLRVTVGGGAASARFPRPRPGLACLVSVCAAPAEHADFTPLPWGASPASVPSASYRLHLRHLTPHHATAAPSGPGPGAIAVPADGVMPVASGLPRLKPRPRLSGGGASGTGVDVRSGNPGEVNIVDVAGYIAGQGRTLVGVSFAYRYVVGFSGNAGNCALAYRTSPSPLTFL